MLLLFSSDNRSSARVVLGPESRVLFVRLNRIGDALVATPLITSIKNSIGCTVDVLSATSNSFVFQHVPAVDHIFIYDKRKGYRNILSQLNNIKYDAVFDLHDDVSFTGSYLISKIKSPVKIGLYKKTHKLYTHSVTKPDPTKHHVVERMMALCGPLEIINDTSKINVVYSPKEQSLMNAKYFIEQHFPVKSFLIGVNISAGSAARFWGVLNFKKLLALLKNDYSQIVILADKKDRTHAQQIAESNYPVFIRDSFDDFCGIIPHLNMLITPDTSIVHVASAYLIPVFGLYVRYNTSEVIWYPYRSLFDYVETTDSALNSISYDDVKKKIIPFIKRVQNG